MGCCQTASENLLDSVSVTEEDIRAAMNAKMGFFGAYVIFKDGAFKENGIYRKIAASYPEAVGSIYLDLTEMYPPDEGYSVASLVVDDCFAWIVEGVPRPVIKAENVFMEFTENMLTDLTDLVPSLVEYGFRMGVTKENGTQDDNFLDDLLAYGVAENRSGTLVISDAFREYLRKF